MTISLKEADLKPIGRSMQLPLSALEPSGHNRDVGPTDEIRGLARSIAEVGLLYPLIVQKKEDEPDRYVIKAGERRYRALRHLGVQSVACVVLTGETAERSELIGVVDNHQRRNLSPLEEAAAVRGLLDRDGWDLMTVARSLGRSRVWVARRASLTDLSERWVLEIRGTESETSRIPDWPPSHLEIIARFPPEVQDRMLDAYGNYWRREIPRFADLLSVTSDYQRLLSGAPWKLDDVTVCPEAGCCVACIKRSAHHPELFPEELPGDNGKPTSGDRCLDPICWRAKAREFILRRIEELKRENPKLVLLDAGEDDDQSDIESMLQDNVYRMLDVAPCRKSAEGAIPALIVNGPGLGRLRYVQDSAATEPESKPDLERSDSSSYAPPPATEQRIEDRKAVYDRRRQQAVIDAVKAKLRLLVAEPDREKAVALEGGTALLDRGMVAKTLLLLSILLESCGWRREASGNATWPVPEEWEALGKLKNHEIGREERQAELLGRSWELLRLVGHTLVARLTVPNGCRDNSRHYDEAESLCQLLGFDLTALRAQAAQSIPYAKSWGGEVVDDWAAQAEASAAEPAS